MTKKRIKEKGDYRCQVEMYYFVLWCKAFICGILWIMILIFNGVFSASKEGSTAHFDNL